mgnify:CR=1 FL=1
MLFRSDLTRSLGHSLGVDTAKTDAEEEDAAAIDEKITAKLAAIDPVQAPPAEVPKEGDPEGKIEIPAIGLRSKTFVEGVAKADLRKGPGHYPSTPLPGNPGNAAIAGHRTTYGAPFNRIDELKPGDQIITYTLQGKFVYEVLESPVERRAGDEGGTWGPGWFAVKPNDVSVLAPTDDNRLTLTACHPKYSAKLRIIVQAKLVAEPAEAPTTTVPTTDPATGADGTDASDSLLTNRVLYPGTIGHALEELFSGVISRDARDRLRSYALGDVSGRSLLPAVRVDDQPYALLPALALSRVKPDLRDSGLGSAAADERAKQQKFEDTLLALFRHLHRDWSDLRRGADRKDPVRQQFAQPRPGPCSATDPQGEIDIGQIRPLSS